MSVIKILPEVLANKIAAGEVVERPASLVKELVENSLDAGSTKIFIQASNGGKREIKVADNGLGMKRDDLLLALERHATSKIETAEDLFAVLTLGFRGEALPSIAAVSRMEITSCFKGDTVGHRLRIRGGVIHEVAELGAGQGTTITVARLFYNTPARLKFLKSVSTELDHVTGVVIRLALAHPDVHFRFHHNDREILDFPPTKNLKHRLHSLWGGNIVKRLLEVRTELNGEIRLRGFISPPDLSRSSRRHVHTYVNGRWVNDSLLHGGVYGGYKPFLTQGRYPLAAVFLETDPEKIDVNVHPTKNEVRFTQGRHVYELIKETVYQTIITGSPGPQSSFFTKTRVQNLPGRIMEPSLAAAASSMQAVVPPPPGTVISPLPQTPGPHVQTAPQWEDKPSPSAPLKVLAQLHNSYVLCQGDDGVFILDQHAVHERIIYEKLKHNVQAGPVDKQALVVPELIELSPMDFSLLHKVSQKLGELGLEMEPFGGSSMVVKYVPALLPRVDVQAMVGELLDALNDLPHAQEEETLLDRTLMVMACHGSVKAHQKLTMEEMERMLDELQKLNAPPYCPHGRPVFIKITYEQIEKDLRRR